MDMLRQISNITSYSQLNIEEKCLNYIRDDVIDAFKYIQAKSDFAILKMEPDKDHIHFLLEFKPSMSIDSVVNRMKAMSTNYLYMPNADNI